MGAGASARPAPRPLEAYLRSVLVEKQLRKEREALRVPLPSSALAWINRVSRIPRAYDVVDAGGTEVS